MGEPTAQATVADVRVAAAHEGVAELVVTLAYPNGGRTEVALDEPAVTALMAACNAQSEGDLLGCSWRQVRDALQVSWNRLTPLR